MALNAMVLQLIVVYWCSWTGFWVRVFSIFLIVVCRSVCFHHWKLSYLDSHSWNQVYNWADQIKEGSSFAWPSLEVVWNCSQELCSFIYMGEFIFCFAHPLVIPTIVSTTSVSFLLKFIFIGAALWRSRIWICYNGLFGFSNYMFKSRNGSKLKCHVW